jgi:hypothetical protein
VNVSIYLRTGSCGRLFWAQQCNARFHRKRCRVKTWKLQSTYTYHVVNRRKGSVWLRTLWSCRTHRISNCRQGEVWLYVLRNGSTQGSNFRQGKLWLFILRNISRPQNVQCDCHHSLRSVTRQQSIRFSVSTLFKQSITFLSFKDITLIMWSYYVHMARLGTKWPLYLLWNAWYSNVRFSLSLGGGEIVVLQWIPVIKKT